MIKSAQQPMKLLISLSAGSRGVSTAIAVPARSPRVAVGGNFASGSNGGGDFVAGSTGWGMVLLVTIGAFEGVDNFASGFDGGGGLVAGGNFVFTGRVPRII